MAGLVDIDFATDEELQRYESEILTLAEDNGITLASVRDGLIDELVEECALDGVDPTKVVIGTGAPDTVADAARALRIYATRKALRIFWEDMASGREASISEGKAKRAQDYEARARDAFRRTGWPVDTTGDDAITSADIRQPITMEFTR